MKKQLVIDPITRIEGHLGIRLVVENNVITDAFCQGEMFRGFEAILGGRDPLDAQQIVQRICGVCPISHGIASIKAQEQAYGVQPPENGRIARNIILASNFIQSHITHFYHFSAPDFIDISDVEHYNGEDNRIAVFRDWLKSEKQSKSIQPAAPFFPRYEHDLIDDPELNISVLGHYLHALEVRAVAHRLGAVFGGKIPHAATLVPGGITQGVHSDQIAVAESIIVKIQEFIDHIYLPDVAAVAEKFRGYFDIGKSCGNYLAYGVFPESENPKDLLFPSGVTIGGKSAPLDQTQITEDVRYARFYSSSVDHPMRGKTKPEPKKEGAYSWIKAPRYMGKVMEVGPLARVIVARLSGKGNLQNLFNRFLKTHSISLDQLDSVMGRHIARVVECKFLADRCAEWIQMLKPGKPVFNDVDIPSSGAGEGLTEAPRGALGHWIRIENSKIENYQCVVPSTWNCSPRDKSGVPGPIEQALIGTPVSDERNPIEAARVVRSFDPCIACAVH